MLGDGVESEERRRWEELGRQVESKIVVASELVEYAESGVPWCVRAARWLVSRRRY